MRPQSNGMDWDPANDEFPDWDLGPADGEADAPAEDED